MFLYYFRLGLHSLRRNPALTALMVLTLAAGVAASVASLTILHVISGDPIPHKSARMFVPLVDNGPLEGYNPANPGRQNPALTYRDARAMLAGLPGVRRTAMYNVGVSIETTRPELPLLMTSGIAATADFFTMFEAPFERGQAWSPGDDAAGADVIVLGHGMADLLFGTADPLGKRVRIQGIDYRVVGVLAAWRVIPKYYRLGSGSSIVFEDGIIIPLNTAVRHEVSNTSSTTCLTGVESGYRNLIESECTWMQVMVEARSSAGRAEVQSWLDHYVSEQRKFGRFRRNVPNQVFDVVEWIDYHHLINDDNRLTAWLAFGFLLLCLVNTVGLLLAKFSARAAEVGVRRALGASRRAVFAQCLTEAGVVGLAGGVAGALLCLGALALLGMASFEMGMIAHMDWQMLLLTFAMSLAAALLAALLPTWRACQIAPAIVLKSQ